MKKVLSFNRISAMMLVLVAIAVIPACAPVFSELQSARTVGDNRAEITGSYSSVSMADEGESDQVQDHAGLQVAYGITDNIDIRARYERVWLGQGEFENGISVVGLGPKFSLMKDNIAFYLPVGNALDADYNDNWQLQPTFLFTVPVVKDNIDFTVAPKYMMTFCDDCDDGLAINFGASFGELKTWALRVEYGLLYNMQQVGDGHYGQFTFGFSYAFGGKVE